MKKVCILVCCMFLSFIISACGESNPLIGTWESKIVPDNELMKSTMAYLPKSLTSSPIMTFNNDSMIIKHGNSEQSIPIKYRKNSDTSWSISIVIDGVTTWEEVKIIDKDTLKMNGQMGMPMVLTRK